MTSLLQTDLNGHLPAPPEKRFLISVHLEIQQLFTSYNERITVEGPPWLNLVDGVVVETTVPILRHHP